MALSIGVSVAGSVHRTGMNLFRLNFSWGERWHGYVVLHAYWSRSGDRPFSGFWANFRLGGHISLSPPSAVLELGPMFFTAVWPMDMRPLWKR